MIGLMGFSVIGETATRLSLHVTQEELNIWRQRAVSGPYKATSDVSTNSPGDYNRIKASADAFVADPDQHRWNGNTGSSCFVPSGNNGPPGKLNSGIPLRDAAFMHVLGTVPGTDYITPVKTELLAQLAVSGFNFGNSTKWSHNSGCWTGPAQAASQEINLYVHHLIIAYDYIKSEFSAGEQTTINAWFTDAMEFFDYFATNPALERFPNRNSDNYTTVSGGEGGCNQILYAGGPTHCNWQAAWENLPGLAATSVASMAISLNNTTYKNLVKRWWKEAVNYLIDDDNSSFELQRWSTNSRDQGWSYWSSWLFHMISIADHFARDGDTSLYDYTADLTQHFKSAGGTKRLDTIIDRLLEYRDKTVTRYANATAGDPLHIIDGENSTHHSIGYISSAIANNYYKIPYFKNHYMAVAPNTYPYPSNPAGGQNYWGGVVGIYPGILFMFGQMDDKVDPFSTADVAPGAPTLLTAVDDGPTDMDLSWTAPAETGGGIGGYRIYRCTGDDCTNFALVADQSGVGTTYTDPNLTPATIYNYQVTAYDISTPANEGPPSNIAEDDTDAGAPATQQTSQATFQCGYSGAIVGEELKEGPDEDCRVVSPSVVRVITGLRNTTGSNPPSTSHHLWCQKNGGTWTEVIDTCDAFDLCYSGSDTVITANQVLSEAILPLGGLIYQEGRAKRSIVPPDLLVVEDGKQVEYMHVLHIKDGLIFGDEFGCCERKAGGVELDACVPATLVVGASEYRNR